ncbi:MAG: cytochrome c [Opitutaceae bacterium]|nr:cytochrome c [Opitutaceae bacterium]
MTTSTKAFIVALATAAVSSIAFGATAEENWKAQCAKCHGAGGEGKAAMKTANYTSADVQAKFTDEQLFEATKNGVKDTKMPAYGAKGMSDDDIKALVAHIRSLKK